MLKALLESARYRGTPKGALAAVLAAWTLLPAYLPARADEALNRSATCGLELFTRHDFAGASAAFQETFKLTRRTFRLSFISAASPSSRIG